MVDMINVGDILSTVGAFQYHGGYREYCGDILSTVGDILSTVRVSVLWRHSNNKRFPRY